jgi:hypothetical protein
MLPEHTPGKAMKMHGNMQSPIRVPRCVSSIAKEPIKNSEVDATLGN